MPTKRRPLARQRAVTVSREIKGWLVKTAVANMWRVPSYYALDDLIEDGLICYFIVRDHYPDISDPRHIMALFKTTYHNHLKILSNTARIKTTALDENMFANLRCPEGDMLEFIGRAPGYLRRLFLAIVNRPELVAEPLARYEDGTRETTNERLCRIVGIDPTTHDLQAEAADFLGWSTT